MKIYTKVTIDMATGEILEEESFDYEGPLALCGGDGDGDSGDSGDTGGGSPAGAADNDAANAAGDQSGGVGDSNAGFGGGEGGAQGEGGSDSGGGGGGDAMGAAMDAMGISSPDVAAMNAAAAASQAHAQAQAAQRDADLSAAQMQGMHFSGIREALGLSPAKDTRSLGFGTAKGMVSDLAKGLFGTDRDVAMDKMADLSFNAFDVREMGFNPTSPHDRDVARAAAAIADRMDNVKNFGFSLGKRAAKKGAPVAAAALQYGVPAKTAAKAALAAGLNPGLGMFAQMAKTAISDYSMSKDVQAAVNAARHSAPENTDFEAEIAAQLDAMGYDVSPHSIGNMGLGISPSPEKDTNSPGGDQQKEQQKSAPSQEVRGTGAPSTFGRYSTTARDLLGNYMSRGRGGGPAGYTSNSPYAGRGFMSY